MKDLSILIVNYNSGTLTNNCIESIEKTVKRTNYEIIVVDNASPDKSGKIIKTGENITLIELDKNIGFSGGNNVAINHSTGKYILLLNPDTIVLDNTIDEIFNYYENSNQILGAIGCKIINSNGDLDKGCKRAFPTLMSSICHFTKLDKIFPNNKVCGSYNLTYIDEDTQTLVECISGAFMFMKREVINKIGLLDERYFMHAEDIDLCFRIIEAGYNILYYPKVKTIHLKGQSSKTNSNFVVNHFFDSMWLFYEKHYYNKKNKVSNYLAKIGILSIKKAILLKNRIIK